VTLAKGCDVSVLLPAWNGEATIGAALASVQRQERARWECVVVDDGSTDDTASIVEAVAATDHRIRLIRTAHRGLVAALNEGLSHCSAPLIARMDADDVMHRERLALQAKALEADRSLGAVGCHVRLFPRSAMSPRLREYEAWLNDMRSAEDISRDRFIECPVAHPTVMMRRDVAALGYVDRGWPEDYDLVLRALSGGFRFGIVTKRLLAWRDRSDSHCRTSAVYDADRFTACKAFYLAHSFLAACETYVLWGYGDTGRTLRRALVAHGKRPSHIVEVKASRIHQRIHGASVIPISGLPALRGQSIVVSVARSAPRREIRAALAGMGFVEGADFVCAA
jgi:glycosyltransferase involved in cell wall biosynthesis